MQKGYPHVKTQMPHIFQGTAKTCFEHIYCSKIASHCCTVCYNSLKSAHSRNSQYNHNYLEMAFKNSKVFEQKGDLLNFKANIDPRAVLS